jgi:hypothetical protein
VYLRRSEHHAAGWGSDWLDRSEVVAPGIDRRFQLPPGATWDVMIRACDGREIATARELPWAGDQRLRVSEIAGGES